MIECLYTVRMVNIYKGKMRGIYGYMNNVIYNGHQLFILYQDFDMDKDKGGSLFKECIGHNSFANQCIYGGR